MLVDVQLCLITSRQPPMVFVRNKYAVAYALHIEHDRIESFFGHHTSKHRNHKDKYATGVLFAQIRYNAEVKKIHCSNCGQLVNETANFCWSCGAALHGEESAVYRAGAEQVDPAAAPEHAHHLSNPELQKLLDETFPPRRLSPPAILLFFFNYIGITALLLPLFVIGAFFEPVLVAIGFGFYLIILYLIAVIVYNHFVFSVEDEGLRIEYGIINKRHVTIPFRQIQNVNITRTLLDRILGIGKLEIESAGSSHAAKRDIVGGTRSKAEGFLPGLTMKEAEHLHDMLLQKAQHEKSRG